MRRRALFAGVLLLLGGAPAWAVDFRVGKQPFRLDLTESLYLSYRTDPGNGRAWTGNDGELVSRLNVQLAWRNLVLGLRLDSAAPWPEWLAPQLPPWPDPSRPSPD